MSPVLKVPHPQPHVHDSSIASHKARKVTSNATAKAAAAAAAASDSGGRLAAMAGKGRLFCRQA
jgi:hypothetical protein